MEYKVKATVLEEYQKIFLVDATSEEEAREFVQDQRYSSYGNGITSIHTDEFYGIEDIYDVEII